MHNHPLRIRKEGGRRTEDGWRGGEGSGMERKGIEAGKEEDGEKGIKSARTNERVNWYGEKKKIKAEHCGSKEL